MLCNLSCLLLSLKATSSSMYKDPYKFFGSSQLVFRFTTLKLVFSKDIEVCPCKKPLVSISHSISSLDYIIPTLHSFVAQYDRPVLTAQSFSTIPEQPLRSAACHFMIACATKSGIRVFSAVYCLEVSNLGV